MIIEVEMPDGSIAEFPQGTPESVITAEIESVLGSGQNKQAVPAVPQQESVQGYVDRMGGGHGYSDVMDGSVRAPGTPAPQNTGMSAIPATDQVERDISKYEELTQRLLDPNIDDAMRNALESQRSALGAALSASDTTGDIAKRLGNLIGDGASAVGRKIARGISIVSPNAGANVERATQGGGESFDVNGRGNAISRAAQDSAIEAARMREAQGITSARGSIGDNITQGRSDAAAQQADAARAGTAPEGQPPRPRPAAQEQDPNTQRLRYPTGISVQGAVPNDINFNMGNGSVVTVRPAPPQAVKSGVQDGMDFLMQRSDQVVMAMLERGDITGAKQFRDFVRAEQSQNGMRDMNTAIIAANYGDTTAFSKAVSGMVKSFDPDGEWQVDESGTGLIINDGQAMGATLSLRNKATGETTTQEYQGMQQVISAISDWASPTAAFERQQERVVGAVSQKVANAESYEQAYNEAMETMFDKSSFVDLEGNAISQEEMARRDQMVRQRIASVRPDLAAPALSSGGAASGVGAAPITGGSSGQPVPTMGQ